MAARPVWVGFIGIVVASALGWLASDSAEVGVRYAGMILQVLGLAMVARGLSKLQLHFGQPSLGARLSSWFRLLGSAFKRGQDVTVHAHSTGGTLSPSGTLTTSVTRAASTVEERVTALESNLTELRAETRSTADALRREVGTLARDVRRERQEREEADRQTAQKVEVASIGDIDLEWVGLLWLILGVVGTSVPGEIARWFTA